MPYHRAPALFALVALTAPSAASAQARQPADPDPAAAQGGTFAVEAGHTQVFFKLSHLGFTSYSGVFSHATGSLILDPRNPAADRVEIVVPVSSVSTTSPKLDEELKGPDWFDAARYPVMTFRSRSVTLLGPADAAVQGDLTLHGVTLPATLTAHFNGAGVNPARKTYTVGFEISGHLKRSAFGVGRGVPMVGDDVDLIISAAFERPAS